jgi:hypothetical protein
MRSTSASATAAREEIALFELAQQRVARRNDWSEESRRPQRRQGDSAQVLARARLNRLRRDHPHAICKRQTQRLSFALRRVRVLSKVENMCAHCTATFALRAEDKHTVVVVQNIA